MTLRSSLLSLLPDPVRAALRGARERARHRRIGVPSALESSDVQWLGTAYGGCHVPGALLGPESACLCFGAGEDISFEEQVADTFGSRVHIFDPTPRAISYCTRRIAGRRGGGQITFHPVGVWSANGTLRFYAPANPEHVSHSILNMNRGPGEFFEAECFTPRTLMKRLEIDRVDLVKLNIEGAEYEVVRALLSEGVRPVVLCVTYDEMHSQLDRHAMRRMRELSSRIIASGFRAAAVRGSKVTFTLQTNRG